MEPGGPLEDVPDTLGGAGISTRQQFVHQYRPPMFGDRGKGSLALESMIPVGSPHAFDETLFSKDMLRSPVRGFGGRHGYPFRTPFTTLGAWAACSHRPRPSPRGACRDRRSMKGRRRASHHPQGFPRRIYLWPCNRRPSRWTFPRTVRDHRGSRTANVFTAWPPIHAAASPATRELLASRASVPSWARLRTT